MSKSSKNKTIDTTVEDGAVYLERCVTLSDRQDDVSAVLDKTILGDMLKICPLLPAHSVDLIFADPPYNLTKSFNGTIFAKKKTDAYEKYTREWLSAVKPLLKENGSIYVCCDWETSLTIGKVLGEFFRVRNRITWQREKGRGANANWKNGMEDIWFATNSDNYYFDVASVKVRKKVIAPYRSDGKPKDWEETENGNFRDTCPSNFWDDITIPFWSMPENTAHPTQKSEKLLAKVLLASTAAGYVVLDPFLGSGTTSVVAKKLNRHYIGIEVEPRYCVWAEQRLEIAEVNRSIQGYANGVFWERNSFSEQKSAPKKKRNNSRTTARADSSSEDGVFSLFDTEE